MILRDLLIFQIKLTLDGIKDIVLSPLAIWVAIFDIVLGGKHRGRWFYKVMRFGERFDRWLNLFESVKRADIDGLFGGSKAGDSTFVGQIEQAVRGGDEIRKPTPTRQKESVQNSASTHPKSNRA